MTIENFTNIKAVFGYLVAAAVIAFSSQFLYLDVLKTNDISFVEPVGNVLINIMSVIIGVYFLKEEINTKKICGIALGCFSLLLLA